MKHARRAARERPELLGKLYATLLAICHITVRWTRCTGGGLYSDRPHSLAGLLSWSRPKRRMKRTLSTVRSWSRTMSPFLPLKRHGRQVSFSLRAPVRHADSNSALAVARSGLIARGVSDL